MDISLINIENKNIVIVGAQWGDEGKGKIVDAFAQNSTAVVRFHGEIMLAILYTEEIRKLFAFNSIRDSSR